MKNKKLSRVNNRKGLHLLMSYAQAEKRQRHSKLTMKMEY